MKKKLKVILRAAVLILSTAGTVLFANFFIFGLINIGSITGFVLSLTLLLYTVFAKKINIFLKKIRKRKSIKIITDIILIFIISAAALAVVETSFMIYAANKQPPEDSTVIVLGCRVYDERPSRMLKERLNASLEYLKCNPEAVCIVSGGRGRGENISEAECMYRYLSENGISPERIYKEDSSGSTKENINNSFEIIEKYGLSKNAAIVTSEFHEYRASCIVKEYTADYGAVSAKTKWYLFPAYYIRELYGILYEWIL